MTRYRYLHFATHADLPGRLQGINEPFLLLGQVENTDEDDGLLALSEVLDLRLDAEMVVLSACVTGRGEATEGEGVVNFARAFHQAGARSVVVSLWEVASEAAEDFMRRFYGHLQAGETQGRGALPSQKGRSRHSIPTPSSGPRLSCMERGEPSSALVRFFSLVQSLRQCRNRL